MNKKDSIKSPMAALARERLEPYQLHIEGSGAVEFACVEVVGVVAQEGMTEITLDQNPPQHELRIVLPWTCPEAMSVKVGMEVRLFGSEVGELHGVTIDGKVMFWRTDAMVEQRNRRATEDADARRVRADHAFRMKATATDVTIAPIFKQRLANLRQWAHHDHEKNFELPERLAMLLAQRMWNFYELADEREIPAIRFSSDEEILKNARDIIAGHEDYPWVVQNSLNYLRMLDRMDSGELP